jgi:hypothetical protein
MSASHNTGKHCSKVFRNASLLSEGPRKEGAEGKLVGAHSDFKLRAESRICEMADTNS